MKRVTVVVIALLLVLFLLPSCAGGIPQEEYNKATSDLTAAQAQIQSLESDLTAKESELEAIKGKLEQGKARIEILNVIVIPTMTGEVDRMTDAEVVKFFLEWRDKILAVEDPILTSKFEALIETVSDQTVISFFAYLLESTTDALK